MNGLFGSSSWLYIIWSASVGLLGVLHARQPHGLPADHRAGHRGAVAGWFGQYMGWYAPGAGRLGAVVGAVAVLAVLRLFSGRR
jgi:uncharacterized membrane protein YeaQ/YmgE (transglycosylase-associated protein family)